MEPEISGLEFFLEAFAELGTSRSVGMSLGPISFTAIAEYFRIYELNDFDEFAYIIRRLDNTFLELNAADEPADKAKGGGESASNNRNKKNPNQGRHGRQ